MACGYFYKYLYNFHQTIDWQSEREWNKTQMGPNNRSTFYFLSIVQTLNRAHIIWLINKQQQTISTHHHQRQTIGIVRDAQFWWPSFIKSHETTATCVDKRRFDCFLKMHLMEWWIESHVFSFFAFALASGFVHFDAYVLMRWYSPNTSKNDRNYMAMNILGLRHFNHQHLLLNIIITAFMWAHK